MFCRPLTRTHHLFRGYYRMFRTICWCRNPPTEEPPQQHDRSLTLRAALGRFVSAARIRLVQYVLLPALYSCSSIRDNSLSVTATLLLALRLLFNGRGFRLGNFVSSALAWKMQIALLLSFPSQISERFMHDRTNSFHRFLGVVFFYAILFKLTV